LPRGGGTISYAIKNSEERKGKNIKKKKYEFF